MKCPKCGSEDLKHLPAANARCRECFRKFRTLDRTGHPWRDGETARNRETTAKLQERQRWKS